MIVIERGHMHSCSVLEFGLHSGDLVDVDGCYLHPIRSRRFEDNSGHTAHYPSSTALSTTTSFGPPSLYHHVRLSPKSAAEEVQHQSSLQELQAP